MQNNKLYWKLSSFFFLFFLSIASIFTFFAIWLGQSLNLSGAQTGIVFSVNAVFTMLFQPLYGYISDKLGLRKNLLYFISILVILSGPFLIFIYQPLLNWNFWIGALTGGSYLAITFLAGISAIESYIEKVGRKHEFEFGRARLWGSIGAAVAAAIGGRMLNINPDINFWIASGSGILLLLVIFLTKVEVSTIEEKKAKSLSVQDLGSLFKRKDFWIFMIFMLGTGCIYNVFDQQFPVYYASLFPTEQLGNQIFGYLNAGQVFLESGMLLVAPFIVRKVGPKGGLILAGIIMILRVIGSGLVSDPYSISFIKLLNAPEFAIIIVSVFKYLATHFDTKFSSILYLVGYQFAMQLGAVILSPIVGNLYDSIGFRQTYLIMGVIVTTFTLFGAFLLRNQNQASKDRNDSKLTA
ncbi:MFS transporter [Priestia megaterium]|uniref:MFS transporter n=1 Tax=Priestia megaterium TaxID=1404 RepID=UPI001C240EDE|nr:MFS transporter [Priestia megaterium]MBU8753463.1 MFS transporter [Priestia megaterium]